LTKLHHYRKFMYLAVRPEVLEGRAAISSQLPPQRGRTKEGMTTPLQMNVVCITLSFGMTKSYMSHFEPQASNFHHIKNKLRF
jgi:hypothetical protein